MNNHMRQGNNNNKRSRGRGRKPQNSSNRAYDSTGPDVKIRGTAAHVCEKYQQLARDSLSAGDRVTAENYYQHAEHYYRLLMTSQATNDGQPRPQNSLGYRPQEDEEEEFDQNEQGGEQNLQPQQRSQHQPYNNNGNNNGGHRQQGEYSQGGGNGNQPRAPQPSQQPEFAAESEEQPATPDSFVAESDGAVPQAQADGQRRREGRRRRRRPEGGGASSGSTEEREEGFERAATPGEEAL